MKFKGDTIITDPCYLIENEDWHKYKDGVFECDMSKYGIKTAIIKDNEVGDGWWSTYIDGNNTKLGDFTADTGRIGVYLLKEVLEFNPKFNYHIEKPWTTTLIKDFDGEIDIVHRSISYEMAGEKFNENIVSVVGRGNINFSTE